MTTRIACVEVPALPLQLLIGEHPEWAGRPVAVVAEDRPQGRILWVNEQAHASRVLPGQRYAAALGLCRELCAAEVSPERIDRGVERLVKRLTGFSPEVEPSKKEPGVFWVNAGGLTPLYTSLETWARRIRDALAREGFASRVVVGFSRFGSYAVARAAGGKRGGQGARGVIVFEDEDREAAAARRVRLDRLHLDPDLRDTLGRLAIHTIADFLKLPPGAVEQRFGTEAQRLHRLARGDLHAPLDGRQPEEPVQTTIQFEHPETDATRLLFLVKRDLHPLLEETATRGEALTALELAFALDDRGRLVRKIEPATPTLDAAQILDLVHLSLERLRLRSGAVEMTLTIHGQPATREQLRLFAEHPRRDLRAADRAFARIRTEFGRHAVVHARMRDGHLPEARFTWEPLRNLCLPRTPDRGPGTAAAPLVRRIHARPLPLPVRTRNEPDGWLVRGLEQGPVMTKCGPYVVSGAWWARSVHREYHFLTTQRGDVLWVYFDRRRRRWFLQGQVE